VACQGQNHDRRPTPEWLHPAVRGGNYRFGMSDPRPTDGWPARVEAIRCALEQVDDQPKHAVINGRDGRTVAVWETPSGELVMPVDVLEQLPPALFTDA